MSDYREFTLREGGHRLNAGTLDGTTEAATSPILTYVNGSWNATTRVYTVPGGSNPVADGVTTGMYASLAADTNTAGPAGYYAAVVGVTTTTITLNSTFFLAPVAVPATGGSFTLRIGGAWAVPAGGSGADSFPFNYNLTPLSGSNTWPRLNVKARSGGAAHRITGTLLYGVASAQGALLQGYGTTFGDGVPALFDVGSVGSFILLQFQIANLHLIDFIFDCSNFTSGSNSAIVANVNTPTIERVAILSAPGHGIEIGASGTGFQVLNCAVLGFGRYTTGRAGIVTAEEGVIDQCFLDGTGSSNDCDGIQMTIATNEPIFLGNTIIKNCTRAGIRATSTPVMVASHLTIDNCSLGVQLTAAMTSAGNWYMRDSIITRCATGMDAPTFANQSNVLGFRNIYFWDVTTQSSNLRDGAKENWVTITANPFVDATNNDYRLNNNNPGGAELTNQAVAFHPVFPADFPSYAEPGAMQREVTSSSGGGVILIEED
jgi:hypothetical protein